jgi:hypothetical protein
MPLFSSYDNNRAMYSEKPSVSLSDIYLDILCDFYPTHILTFYFI